MTNDDMISRQAAIEAMKNLLDSMIETDTIGFYEIENVLFELPSAQPEIVRCKDCKYSSPNKVYGCRIYSFADDLDERMYADDFCSRAERRTDG